MIPRDSRLTRHPSCLTNGVHLKPAFPDVVRGQNFRYSYLGENSAWAARHPVG